MHSSPDRWNLIENQSSTPLDLFEIDIAYSEYNLKHAQIKIKCSVQLISYNNLDSSYQAIVLLKKKHHY